MASRLSLAILGACLVAAPDVAVAQVPGGDVTLKVPVNFTKLSADLAKIRLSCTLDSPALLYDEQKGMTSTRIFADSGYLPVSNGQFVTTFTIVFTKFTLKSNSAGVTATYRCDLDAEDRTGFGAPLGDPRAGQTYPQFKLTPTPAALIGTFTW